MKNQVHWLLELSIKDGKFDELKTLINEMTKSTKEHEKGALNYEWYVDDDKTACHIYERYEDSDAVMVHMGNFQEKFAARFFDVLDVKRFTVYGAANEQVKNTLGGVGAQFMHDVGGFVR